MLSRKCKERNETIIPALLNEHGHLTPGPDPIDMSSAENWLMRQEMIKAFAEDGGMSAFTVDDLSYAEAVGGCPDTRSALATFFNTYFSPAVPVSASHIVLTAGAKFGLTALVEQLADAGDSIMIATPYWSSLDVCITASTGTKVIPVHIPLSEFFTIGSIRYYEEALRKSTSPVKAVLICNPHNPLGQCYPRRVLQAILDFTTKHQLHLISDELYGMSVFGSDPPNDGSLPFISALSLKDTSASVHVVYSLSKDFGCSGFRLGALVSQTNTAVRMSAALTAYCQVSTASTVLLGRSILPPDRVARYVTQNHRLLRDAYRRVEMFLQKRGIEYVPAHAGIFVFARLCPTDSAATEKEFQMALRERDVFLASGTSYRFAQRGWFRMIFSIPERKIDEGLRRIAECIDEVAGSNGPVEQVDGMLLTRNGVEAIFA